MQANLLKPVQKTLVLGLGGTGKKVLVQLKRRILEEGYADTPRQPDLRLMCLDFDPADEYTAFRQDGRGTVRLAPDEICWLDANSIHRRLRNMNQPHNWSFYSRWYPDQEGTMIQMGSFRAGAAQWRPLGRIGYFEHANRIQVVLRRSLNRLLEVEVDRSAEDAPHGVAVYLVCSLSGGTGGGIFLDVAYFLRSLPVDITQIGMFLLPGIYAEYDISGRLYANTYACLKELAAFANQTREFNAVYPNGRRISVPRHGQSPFDHIFLYDNILLPQEVTNNPQMMASVMAETIYFDVAETRLGQMHHSAITNAASGGDVTEHDELAQASVFATAGSLTLLLPSLNQIRDYWGRRYVLENIIGEIARQDDLLSLAGLEAGGSASAGQVLNREKFPGLERYIGELLRKTGSRCRQWPDDYIRRAGEALGKEMLKFRHQPDQAMTYLDRWLEALVEPGNEGAFTRVPDRLPDTDTSPRGPLLEAMEELKRELEHQIRQVRDDEDGAAGAEDIFWYLRSKAQALRDKVRNQAKELRSYLQATDRSFAELKKDLHDLFKADPPTQGGISQMAAAHWARRFLTAVKNSYDEYGLEVRTHRLLAQVLDQVCDEHFLDQDTFQAVVQAVPKLREILDRDLEQAAQAVEQHNSLVVRSLADRVFWDHCWKKLSQLRADQGGDLVGFLIHLRGYLQREGSRQRITPKLLARLAREYGRIRMDEILSQGQDLLDLHEFVNPQRRKEEMARARHDYLLTNRMLNSNENRRAYASVPAYSRRSSKVDNGEIYRALDGDVGNVLSATPAEVETYDPSSQLGEDGPGKILIRHLSLNHPASNLRSIAEYYNAYSRYGRNRKLFHVDKSFSDLPEVIDASRRNLVVTCGNPGCQEDITDLPRETIICPHCQRPIKSRCGNPDCSEDQLHLHPDMAEPNPNKFCPVCKGEARTYWWRCQHHNEYIRTESKFCEFCLAEKDSGRDPSRRDGVKPYILCPGCEHDCIEDPFKIEFLEVYDQVPDHRVGDAWQVYYEETRQGYCEKCGARLLPFCPYQKPGERVHFVHRLQPERDCRERDQSGQESLKEIPRGRFYCTSDQDHSMQDIYECSYCHLPLSQGATYCPRCKHRVPEGCAPLKEGESPDRLLANLERALAPQLKAKAEDQRQRILAGLGRKLTEDGWIFFGLTARTLELLAAEEANQQDKGENHAACANGKQSDYIGQRQAAEFKRGLEEER